MQNTDQTRKLSVDETARKVFTEPEISEPVDVLEATAFFQVIVGGTDTTGDVTG